jgi:hypothetical protein
MQQELGEARHAQRKRALAARRAVRRVTCTITARDEARHTHRRRTRAQSCTEEADASLSFTIFYEKI